LCIVCGDADCSFRNVSFSSRFIKKTFGHMGQAYRRTLNMMVPLCEEHRGHFTAQMMRALGIMGAVFLLFMSFGVGTFSIAASTMFGSSSLLGLVVAGGMAVLGVVAIVFLIRGFAKCVTAQEITERSITLQNVSGKFARAVETGDWKEKESRSRKGRQDDEEFSPPNRTFRTLMVIGVFLVIFLGCGGVIAVFQSVLFSTMRPGPTPQPETPPQNLPAVPVTPLAIDPAWKDNEMQTTFLADLPEYNVTVGYGTLGKNGVHGFGFPGVAAEQNRVFFKGKASTRALAMVPHERGSSRVKYRLDGHKLFVGWAAMADLPPNHPDRQAASPFVCSVLGDGRQGTGTPRHGRRKLSLRLGGMARSVPAEVSEFAASGRVRPGSRIEQRKRRGSSQTPGIASSPARIYVPVQ
jgi:hypothetical protein